MQSYDVNKPTKFSTYLDANNLYGWAMSQYLPYSGFIGLNQKEINRSDENLIEENSHILEGHILEGHILEVDLKYPD